MIYIETHKKKYLLFIASLRSCTNYVKFTLGIYEKYKEINLFLGISILTPNICFVWNLKCWAAFLRSRRLYIYIYACHILYVSYDIHVRFIVIYDIWPNLYDRYMYICKRLDIRNSAQLFKVHTKQMLGLTIEIPKNKCFPLYFS